MLEVLIYDERDKSTEHPESSLGRVETFEEAIVLLRSYLESKYSDQPPIYKVEIRGLL